VPSVSPLAAQSGAYPTVTHRGSASVPPAEAATLLPGTVPADPVHSAATAIGGVRAYGSPPPPPPPPTAKTSLLARRPMLIAGGLVLVAIIAAVAVTLSNLGNGGGNPNGAGQTLGVDQTTGAAPTTEAAAPIPPDEQCTEEIKANPRWVCLTSAVFDGNKITISYDASWNGGQPALDSFHVHFWAAKNGNNPPETTKGTQFPDHGGWYIDDQEPSVRKINSADFREGIGANGQPRAAKVCARIADAQHRLVEDKTGNGTYHTGNCVKITNSS
jgi:hypothetical protein